MTPPKLPNCLQCRHYFITHIPTAPYGCRAMGFKSKRLPAAVVYETSGLVCQSFMAKTVPSSKPSAK